MSEFYELRRKNTTNGKSNSVDYWKARCKESEAKVKELNQALVISAKTIDMLETTLNAIENFFRHLIGKKDAPDKSLLKKILRTNVTIEKRRGAFPEVEFSEIESEDPIGELKQFDGLSIDASILNGLLITGITKDD